MPRCCLSRPETSHSIFVVDYSVADAMIPACYTVIPFLFKDSFSYFSFLSGIRKYFVAGRYPHSVLWSLPLR